MGLSIHPARPFAYVDDPLGEPFGRAIATFLRSQGLTQAFSGGPNRSSRLYGMTK